MSWVVPPISIDDTGVYEYGVRVEDEERAAEIRAEAGWEPHTASVWLPGEPVESETNK